MSGGSFGIPIFRIRTPEETEIAQDLLQLSRSLPPLRPKAIPVPVVVTHSTVSSSTVVVAAALPTPPDTPNPHINFGNGHTNLKFNPSHFDRVDVTITNLDERSSPTPPTLTQLQPFHLQTVSMSPPPDLHHHHNNVTFQHPPSVVQNTNVIMHHGSGTNGLVIRTSCDNVPLTPSTSEYSSDAENVCPGGTYIEN
jgi:hypothetical protein